MSEFQFNTFLCIFILIYYLYFLYLLMGVGLF